MNGAYTNNAQKNLLENPRVRLGFCVETPGPVPPHERCQACDRALDDGFVQTLDRACPLCVQEIDRTLPVAMLPCCGQGVHVECSQNAWDASAQCPRCWTEANMTYPGVDVFSLQFLQTLHTFFCKGNWYHVFVAAGIPAQPFQAISEISGANSGQLQAFLLAHSTTIFRALCERRAIEPLLRATGFSVEFLDLFYEPLADGSFEPADPPCWKTLLINASQQACRAGSAFAVLFALLGGDITPEMLRGMAPAQLWNLGIGYPQLLQIRWTPRGPLKIPEEAFELLGIPCDI